MSSSPDTCRDPRAGFTLTELVFSVALLSLVLAQAGTALIASQRLYEATVADLELTLQSRALREKLLFNLNDGEGGLMNASLNELEIEDPKPNGKGKALKFKPKKGPANRLRLGNNRKLTADRGRPAWLENRTPGFQSEDLFCVVPGNNGTLLLDLDLGFQIRDRSYRQRNQAKIQIVNP
ncbi:MAG: prepilin-type N-terminal cleavage/methylation domain-containing protein [Kiritimatiellia bacterium]|jgi:prepilin-type N-terminal cleavage/methylation domain-containing protein|nr:prepilin-type N-terminal cleavage/methylation domain-containing protein [Kiritimatiellia bacterium]